MKCIVCHKEIFEDEELCFECNEYYKKYPKRVRERILGYYRNLINKEGGSKENEELE